MERHYVTVTLCISNINAVNIAMIQKNVLAHVRKLAVYMMTSKICTPLIECDERNRTEARKSPY